MKRALVGAVLVLAGFLVVRALLPLSDEEAVAAAIEDARTALLDGDREAFLGPFAEDVAYVAGGSGATDRAALARDTDRFLKSPIRRITVLSEEISVSGDTAVARLRCDLGAGIRSVGTVDVRIVAVKDEEGTFRVRRFEWK